MSSLEDFIHFVDAACMNSTSCHFLMCCCYVQEMSLTGIDYLHQKNMAGRDLKAGNTLVSNQHYNSRDGSWAEL